jgi:hypothetical protein
MSRSLAKAVWPDGTERYFIHCNTAGVSFSRLFTSAEQATEIYRTEGFDALKSARVATDLEVVRIAIADGWVIEGNEAVQHGLATSDQLLYCPSDDFSRDDPYSAQERGGAFHLAQFVDGGFDGHYNAPICTDGRYDENAKDMPLKALAGQMESICQACRSRALGVPSAATA